jgi:hypothetical protein
LKSIAAVRANTMQAITNKRILDDGHPSAATTSAPSANGNAKMVCEKRISRRKRVIESFTPIPSPVDARNPLANSCLFFSIFG